MNRTIRMKSEIETMNLRPRNEGKEIAGVFRFKPVDTTERIADTLSAWHGVDMPKHHRERQTSNSPRNSSLSPERYA